jgi:hypothetical protein
MYFARTRRGHDDATYHRRQWRRRTGLSNFQKRFVKAGCFLLHHTTIPDFTFVVVPETSVVEAVPFKEPLWHVAIREIGILELESRGAPCHACRPPPSSSSTTRHRSRRRSGTGSGSGRRLLGWAGLGWLAVRAAEPGRRLSPAAPPPPESAPKVNATPPHPTFSTLRCLRHVGCPKNASFS